MAFQNPGGGENVMLKLKETLTAMGHEVDIFAPALSEISRYDVFHHFSCVDMDLWAYFKGNFPEVPLIVTPTIYLERSSRQWLRWKIHLWGLRMEQRAFGTRENYFQYPDIWLPATESESGILKDYYGLAKEQMRVLPNGVAPQFSLLDPEPFRRQSGVRGAFVLHVGRFHPVKNQRTLLRACAAKGLQAVFIGGADEGYADYRDACVQLGRRLEQEDKSGKTKFHFFGHQAFGSEFLRSAYSAASVFALPSEFETFGIAALEGMVAGKPLVLSDKMADKNIFPGARFVDPKAEAAWAEALDESIRTNFIPDKALIAKTLEKYSWNSIAGQLLDCYREAIHGAS